MTNKTRCSRKMDHLQNFSKRFIASTTLLLFLLLLGLFTYEQTANAGQIDRVRVGIFDNKPMCYFDDTGKAAGVFVSIVEYVASKEGWKLIYVKDSFSSLITKLKNGEIDILLSTAVSEERMNLYAYNKTDVFHNWAEVYISPKTEIKSLLDLKEKRIATVNKGIYSTGPEGIIRLDEKFKLNSEFILVDDYKTGLKAVKEGSADAAVVNRLTGATYGKEFGLKKSGIVFAPVKIRFALNKESSKTSLLIKALDRHLTNLKQDNNSIYHKAVKRWLGGVIEVPKYHIPHWLIYAFLVTFCIILIFFFWNRTLRIQIVQRKKAEEALQDSEVRFRSLSDAAFEGIIISDKGKIIDVNNTLATMFGYSTTELVGMKSIDLASPENRDEIQNKILFGHEKTYESDGIKKDGTIFPVEVRAKMFSFKRRQVRVTALRDITEQKKAEEEIRTLRGILPICSYCKKIRNDKGAWNIIEAYICSHSEAEFSHGVCPECYEKHKDD